MQESTAPSVAPATVESQLSLRLFARVATFRHAPPDRALWRELVDLALGARATVPDVDGRAVAASTVHHVAWALYARADSAGILSNFTVKTLAADCRLTPLSVRRAIGILAGWHVVARTRPSRRLATVYRLNVGGLDWPAVRRRVARDRAASGLLSNSRVGYSVTHPRATGDGRQGSSLPLASSWPRRRRRGANPWDDPTYGA